MPQLRGRLGDGTVFKRSVRAKLAPAGQSQSAIPSLWARAKVDHLLAPDLANMQRGQSDPPVEKAVTDLGVNFSLLTPYTSFVAVEEKTVTEGGQPRTIVVPVQMPRGVSHEGVFGPDMSRVLTASLPPRRTASMASAGEEPQLSTLRDRFVTPRSRSSARLPAAGLPPHSATSIAQGAIAPSNQDVAGNEISGTKSGKTRPRSNAFLPFLPVGGAIVILVVLLLVLITMRRGRGDGSHATKGSVDPS